MAQFKAGGRKTTVDVKRLGSRQSWISEESWNDILRKMSIPCVDMIFQKDRTVLYGWRLIKPYSNVWALPGGRLLRGENLVQCASRIADEYGLTFERLYLNGVFPINFRWRADIPICLAARKISGEPRTDGFEFSKFVWSQKPPAAVGANYARMVSRWERVSRSNDFLLLNRLR
jgi:ADP-ribose pyrophosphatase YjhB (NUDIX family)